jgi:HK97 family phage prohead protease
METERIGTEGPVEFRAAGDGKPAMIVGYAAVYDSPSEDLGGIVEIIRAGAFDRSLRSGVDVMARAEHDSRLILGRTSSGTLRLSTDAKGLRYEVDLPDTQAGRDVAALVRRGDMKASSFAFRLPEPRKTRQRWSHKDGIPLRELLDVDLVDVAPTVDPAYQATSVSARTREEVKGTQPPPGVPAEINEARQRLAESD